MIICAYKGVHSQTLKFTIGEGGGGRKGGEGERGSMEAGKITGSWLALLMVGERIVSSFKGLCSVAGEEPLLGHCHFLPSSPSDL